MKIIKNYTFASCENLKNIRLPNKLETLGMRCFWNSGIEEITVSQTLRSLGEYAFLDAPVKLANVADGCMLDFKNIFRNDTEIKLFAALVPPGTKVVKQNQFQGQNIRHVVIPKSVREIQNFAFANCTNFQWLIFEEGSALESIGHCAFASTGLKNFVAPQSLRVLC